MYHSRPNGSTWEIRSTLRSSRRGRTSQMCSFTRQVGATPWFNRQGQAHIVSTAIRSPGPARFPAEVGGAPCFSETMGFSIDPQPASMSPTVNISIVFILCYSFDCGRIVHHPAIKNDSSAISQPTEWQRIGNQVNAAFVFARADFVNVDHFGLRGNRFMITAAARAVNTRTPTTINAMMSGSAS